MSTEKQAVPSDRKGIPVKTLRFSTAVRPVGIPGKSVADSVSAGGAKNQHRWEIEFQPWARQFRVTYYPPGEDKGQPIYVPESWATYEPLE